MTDDIIGVDISKAHFDVYRTIDGALKQFPNNAAGFSSFRDWLGDMVVGKVVYEPTGCYHKPFEHAFSDQFPLVKVNPLQKHEDLPKQLVHGLSRIRQMHAYWQQWGPVWDWNQISLFVKRRVNSES